MIQLRTVPLLLLLALPGVALAEAPDTLLLVEPGWLAERLDDPAVVVLHVDRDQAAFRQARVPGAVFLPVSAVATERDGIPNQMPDPEAMRDAFEAAGVSDKVRIVVYGGLGGLAATRTFAALELLGHDRVSLLDGGLAAWRADGHPVASGEAAAPARGRLRGEPRPGVVVDADWVREHREDPGHLLLDARPRAHYLGSEGGDPARFPRWGHITGARNVFWQETLEEEIPRFRDPEEVRAMYQAVGAAPDRTVVAYCGTGMQASHAYATARILGYPAVLYDGSFIDWSPRGPEYPVSRDG